MGSGANRVFSTIPLNEIAVRAIAVATASGLTSWEGRTEVRREEGGRRGRWEGVRGEGVRGEGEWMHGGWREEECWRGVEQQGNKEPVSQKILSNSPHYTTHTHTHTPVQ